MEVFHRLEYLEKEWAKTHLKLLKNKLIVVDNNGTEVTTFAVSNNEDEQFIHSFYGI
jgi:hypothetical protein